MTKTPVSFITQKKPGFQAEIGLILGSGASDLAQHIQDPTILNYDQLDQFPKLSVEGHKGQLVLGYLNTIPVACCCGRVHFYEGAQADQFKTMVYTLKHLGCKTLILTNASGSLHKTMIPGQLVIIKDHINLQGFNPLIGTNDDQIGPRFVAMDSAYDPKLRKILKHHAKQLSIPIQEGVYLAVSGPTFETPAEIKAFKRLGADLVGMSTVPEVIVAKHCGLRVTALACISNLASGMSNTPITHEMTLHFGRLGSKNLARLVIASIAELAAS